MAAGPVSTLWHRVGASHGPCNASSTQPWPHTSPQPPPQPGLGEAQVGERRRPAAAPQHHVGEN